MSLEDEIVPKDSAAVKEVATESTPIFRYVNDKDLVIIGVVIIAVFAMFFIPEPTIIISNIIAGLFGIATGRSMGSGTK